jgi:hypothetical protein
MRADHDSAKGLPQPDALKNRAAAEINSGPYLLTGRIASLICSRQVQTARGIKEILSIAENMHRLRLKQRCRGLQTYLTPLGREKERRNEKCG